MARNSFSRDGEVDLLTNSQRAQVIEDWLVSRLAQILRVDRDEIDVHEPFVNYGLGSYQGVELAGDLGEWLKCDLPETLVWDYPTIEEVARYLSEQEIENRN